MLCRPPPPLHSLFFRSRVTEGGGDYAKVIRFIHQIYYIKSMQKCAGEGGGGGKKNFVCTSTSTLLKGHYFSKKKNICLGGWWSRGLVSCVPHLYSLFSSVSFTQSPGHFTRDICIITRTCGFVTRTWCSDTRALCALTLSYFHS